MVQKFLFSLAGVENLSLSLCHSVSVASDTSTSGSCFPGCLSWRHPGPGSPDDATHRDRQKFHCSHCSLCHLMNGHPWSETKFSTQRPEQSRDTYTTFKSVMPIILLESCVLGRALSKQPGMSFKLSFAIQKTPWCPLSTTFVQDFEMVFSQQWVTYCPRIMF